MDGQSVGCHGENVSLGDDRVAVLAVRVVGGLAVRDLRGDGVAADFVLASTRGSRTIGGVSSSSTAWTAGTQEAEPASGDRLSWRTTKVQGRRAAYGVGGAGPTVVFLHGWALGHRSYKRAMRRLVRRGHRVLAPALPGFGGTADLPAPLRTITGYASWVADFLTEVGPASEPVVVIGHSFGGGVAIAFAHDHGERVSQLVLVNSVGGVVDRSLWEWGAQFARDITPGPRSMQALLTAREDLVPNLVRNPRALWDVGGLARRADLREELAELRRRALPVLVVSASEDAVIPTTAFDAICTALGTEGTLLPGNHLWLLADPDAFVEVIANVLQPLRHRTDPRDELRQLLLVTTIPADLADELVRDAPGLWLASDAIQVLAADLALCHPTLGPGEVRARVSTSPTGWRLTVVAPDRPGLLADSALVLAEEGISVASASVATWADRGLALHSLTVAGPPPEPSVLRRLGVRLRADTRPLRSARRIAFEPIGRATVTRSGTANGDDLLTVRAPDQPGLLSAVCAWLAARGASIQAAWIGEDAVASADGGLPQVTDVLVVRGGIDVDELAAFLTVASDRSEAGLRAPLAAALQRLAPTRWLRW